MEIESRGGFPDYSVCVWGHVCFEGVDCFVGGNEARGFPSL